MVEALRVHHIEPGWASRYSKAMSETVQQQLETVLAFFREQLKTRPVFNYGKGLITTPEFFSVATLQEHLNNPLLSPGWIFLKARGQRVPLDDYYQYKQVHRQPLGFLDKEIVNQELRNGAALVLEGIDILDPTLNNFSTQLDESLPCAMVNSVAFFSQRGTEAYQGHVDQDDVLVIQISGKKDWQIFTPQQRRYANVDMLSKEQMGKKIKDLTMRPGDVLYVRAGVPHVCTTTGDHSLHLAFDIIDITPNPKQVTEEANKRYEHDAEDCYVPANQAMEKYIKLVQSEQFKKDVERATFSTKESARQFRRSIGRATGVDALSKYIN